MASLQPLYDLKERLEQAAIAGTGLLAEDFRLKRAVEALAPLAGASPVFARIVQGGADLLQAPPGERGGVLLDLLALADAVLYTQGATGAEGELVPLVPGGGRSGDFSYLQLSPVLEALGGSGGGRGKVLLTAWENTPALFWDFRVLPALVEGLGGGIGGVCEVILRAMGDGVLPWLLKGFDPAGKRDMARRAEMIADLSGERAEQWLRETLPLAKNAVRETVLRELGARFAAEELLDLAVTEKGKCREAVLWALTKREGEAVRAFWAAELAKKPADTLDYFRSAASDTISDLVAQGLRERLEAAAGGVIATRERREELTRWVWSAEGKSSSAMRDLWRWTGEHRKELDGIRNRTDQPLGITRDLDVILLNGVGRLGAGPLAETALDLCRSHREDGRYVTVGLIAALLTEPAAAVYEEFSPLLLTETPAEDAMGQRVRMDALCRGLQILRWDPAAGRQRLENGLEGGPVREPLDSRWFVRLGQALMNGPLGRESHYTTILGGETIGTYDQHFAGLGNPEDPAFREAFLPYFRRRMAEPVRGGVPWVAYSGYILQMGGSLRGILAESLAKSSKPATVHYLWRTFAMFQESLSPAETADVLEEILAGIETMDILVDDPDLAKGAIPYTIRELRAGRPYPVWSNWWSFHNP